MGCYSASSPALNENTYVSRQFLGRTVQHRMAVSLEPGPHALEVVDAHGFRDRTRFYVVR